jgi:PAS domain S-box-containing protein
LLNTEATARITYLAGTNKLVAVIRDISGHKEEVREARAVAQEWRRLVDEQPDAVAILDGGIYGYVNERCADLFGYDNPEELLGKSVVLNLRAEHPELLTHEKEPNGAVRRLEFQGVRRDGTLFNGEAFLKTIVYEGSGKTWARLADVSASRRTEEEREERETRLRLTFETAAVPLVVLDEFMTILNLNAACAELLGVRKDEVENRKSLAEFLVPEDVETARELVRQLPNNLASPALRGEYHLTGKDGVVKTVQMVISSMPGNGGRTAVFIENAQATQVEALREADDEYRPVFEHIGVPAFVAGPDSIVSFVNEEFEKLSPNSKQEREGRSKHHDATTSGC